MTTTGTTSGRVQSSVLIPVPCAEPVVGRWRLDYDPSATAGVPAHVTLLVPWLPPAEIEQADLEALDKLVGDVAAFDFALTSLGWFGRSVLWLAPEPTAPFLELTSRLADRFGTPPWEDVFDEVVPHLTVGLASDGDELAKVAGALAGALPVACRAEEVWVMVGDGTRWSVRHQVALASA